MKIIGIIPARMASTRFPDKPMASILGMPMIGHVYHRSRMCSSLNDVWVATCDEEIYAYVESIGGKAVMTADTHERASDRAAEAMVEIERLTGKRMDYVAMIQGDEPMLSPEMIEDWVKPVKDGQNHPVVNLISPIETMEDFNSPNTVKVVLDLQGNVLYFSREPIPSLKKYSGAIPMWKQLGMILFSRDSLAEYTRMTPTPLEIIESVDMNRFLEHGVRIKTSTTQIKTQSVDTKEDLRRVEELLRNDSLVGKYLTR
jgi:3-deoxy-manno-octulosonate cytidylyltransferase (CMP-KDO synthetase)